MHWDRFDICEAHYLMEVLWHKGGWLHERHSNRRRMEATSIQLARMHFKCRDLRGPGDLEENGQEIYHTLVHRYGFGRRCISEGCHETVPFDQGSDYCYECLMADQEGVTT